MDVRNLSRGINKTMSKKRGQVNKGCPDFLSTLDLYVDRWMIYGLGLTVYVQVYDSGVPSLSASLSVRALRVTV